MGATPTAVNTLAITTTEAIGRLNCASCSLAFRSPWHPHQFSDTIQQGRDKTSYSLEPHTSKRAYVLLLAPRRLLAPRSRMNKTAARRSCGSCVACITVRLRDDRTGSMQAPSSTWAISLSDTYTYVRTSPLRPILVSHTYTHAISDSEHQAAAADVMHPPSLLLLLRPRQTSQFAASSPRAGVWGTKTKVGSFLRDSVRNEGAVEVEDLKTCSWEHGLKYKHSVTPHPRLVRNPPHIAATFARSGCLVTVFELYFGKLAKMNWRRGWG
jgi:hypothetical protein